LLEHTFIHVPGIGPKTEQRLWQRGILTWEDYLKAKEKFFSPSRDLYVSKHLQNSLENRDNILFFRDRLSSGDQWRLFDFFKDGAVYLDIETSGRFQGVDEITVIGLYDGNQVLTYISGINMHEFETAISAYELIITFNGLQFDVPMIRSHFPSISLPPAHIDLRFLLKKLGFQGGLKAIEKQFSLCRSDEIDGMTGLDAVNLWKAYQWGDQKALDRLVAYNTADIVNLKPLMETAYKKMKKKLLGGNLWPPGTPEKRKGSSSKPDPFSRKSKKMLDFS
jgi:uncharacterized protein YprB with RNaseH-like and TPR domain